MIQQKLPSRNDGNNKLIRLYFYTAIIEYDADPNKPGEKKAIQNLTSGFFMSPEEAKHEWERELRTYHKIKIPELKLLNQRMFSIVAYEEQDWRYDETSLQSNETL